MQLIILKNGNAINVRQIKQIMIEDELGKICVDINLEEGVMSKTEYEKDWKKHA